MHYQAEFAYGACVNGHAGVKAPLDSFHIAVSGSVNQLQNQTNAIK
jgi:hypothetical protein